VADEFEVVEVDQRSVLETEGQAQRFRQALEEETFGRAVFADEQKRVARNERREHDRFEFGPALGQRRDAADVVLFIWAFP
jgi:hypothetical protein